MNQDDSRIEQIRIKMHELLAESRLLKKRHDELVEEYLKLKRDFQEHFARTGRAVCR